MPKSRKPSAQKTAAIPVNASDNELIRLGQVALCCLLESPALIAQIDFDLASDLLVKDQRELWRAMAALHGEGL